MRALTYSSITIILLGTHFVSSLLVDFFTHFISCVPPNTPGMWLYCHSYLTAEGMDAQKGDILAQGHTAKE